MFGNLGFIRLLFLKLKTHKDRWTRTVTIIQSIDVKKTFLTHFLFLSRFLDVSTFFILPMVFIVFCLTHVDLQDRA